jgi:hypothetical protein
MNDSSASRFPDSFVWGAATAAHQVEGGNVNSDSWALEHASPSLFREPSGDAVDQYHRFADDVAVLAAQALAPTVSPSNGRGLSLRTASSRRRRSITISAASTPASAAAWRRC